MPPDPLILAFDTSAAHCAAALLSGDEIIAERVEIMARGQAERLFPLLQEVLDDGNVIWKDLTAIGVGIGPGNFTGIRISVASARGLALSLGIPAHGVSSFEALSFGLPRPLITSVDARGGRCFLQEFSDVSVGAPVLAETGKAPCEITVRGAQVVGYLAEEFAAQIGGHPVEQTTPQAVAIARIAAGRIWDGESRPTPLYVRAPDAAPSKILAPKALP